MEKWWGKMENGVEMVMEVGPPMAPLITWDDKKPAVLCFFVFRKTQYSNILWMRITTFRPYWPFINTVGSFIDTDEK